MSGTPYEEERLSEHTFVAFDFETTGNGPAGGAAIVEIGAVKVMGGVIIEEFETLVNPETEIPSRTSMIHGIFDEHVASAPSIREAMLSENGFLDFIGSASLAAHNAPFDMAFLRAAVEKLTGGPLSNSSLCTLKLARKHFVELDNHKLGTVAKHIGSVHTAHKALGDSLMVADILSTCIKRDINCGISTVGQFFKKYGYGLRNGHPLPPRTTVAKFAPLKRSDFF